jgi:hypothetical protein
MSEGTAEPGSPPELAEQARGIRWWWRAARRNPMLSVLSVLLVAQFAIAPVLWDFLHPAWWVKVITAIVLLGPINVALKGFREDQARTLERADESAERTGRRRPVDLTGPEGPPVTFAWNSAAGRFLAAQLTFWITYSILGPAFIWALFTQDPPETTKEWLTALSGSLLLGPGGWFCAIGIAGGHWRKIGRVLKDPAESAIVEVIGFDPATRSWILERQDTGTRITVRLLAGNRHLVAGDTLSAAGTLTTPVKNWRRSTPLLLALSAPRETLWAYHEIEVR